MFKTRFLALLLAAGLLTLPFAAGCGETETPPPKDEPEIQAPPTQPEPQKPETVRYTLSLAERYFLSTAEGAEHAEIGASLLRNGEAFDGEIVYTLSDTTVAEADGGKLTARTVGETLLTATYTPETGDPVSDSAPVYVLAETTEESVNAYEEGSVNLYGRTYFKTKRLQLDNVCTGFEVAFFGTELTLKLRSTISMLVVFVDGSTEGIPVPTARQKSIKLAEKLERGVHTVRAVKAASPSVANQPNCIEIEVAPFSTDGRFLKPPAKPDFKIEFLGDSITEGFGATGKASETTHTLENSIATASYAYLTAQALNADYSIIALNGICTKDSSPSMYEQYTKVGFRSSAEYDFSSFDADIVVLALGENDMWHATDSKLFPNYNTELFQRDYADMLRLIREKRPHAHIVCIYGMMPASSTAQAEQLIGAAIGDTRDENISRIKMVCNETGSNKHPGAQAHAVTAETLTAHIRSLMK